MKTPKNTYIIEGEITKIIINSKKYGYFEVLIDTKNINLVKKYTWGIMYDPKLKGYYVISKIKIEKGYKDLRIHRILTNCPDNMTVDHINHDTLNSLEENLRVCTLGDNKENLGGSQRNNKSSGIRNVTWCRRSNKWLVQIQIKGSKKHIGYYEDIKIAELAAKEARYKYYSYKEI